MNILPISVGNIANLVDPIWEQQPLESQKHYQMFANYMAIPASQRTLNTAWRQWTAGTEKAGKAMTKYFRDLALAWCWAERAAARDMHILTTQQTLWMERDRTRREEQYELGQKLNTQAKRALDRINQIPDRELKISLSEAKDAALAGAQLQSTAIPNLQLTTDQIKWVLSQLPEEKRRDLMQRLARNRGQLELDDNAPVDADVRDVTDEMDADEEQE